MHYHIVYFTNEFVITISMEMPCLLGIPKSDHFFRYSINSEFCAYQLSYRYETVLFVDSLILYKLFKVYLII